MEAGGNCRALDYFTSTGLLDQSVAQRYQMRAAHQYAVDLYRECGQPAPIGFLEPERCPEMIPEPREPLPRKDPQAEISGLFDCLVESWRLVKAVCARAFNLVF
jgi:hypothetical protein